MTGREIDPDGAPWCPYLRADNLDVFHAHDIPLAGTFRVGEQQVLFLCAVGQTYRNSVWAYLDLTCAEAERLAGASWASTSAMVAELEAMFAGRSAGFAFARDNVIAFEGTVAVGDLMDAVMAFVEQVMSATEVAISPADRRRSQQAGADAVLRELSPTG